MKYNLQRIKDRYNAGELLEFVFFWLVTGDADLNKNACLSQWYNCIFNVDGRTYHTAEQFMMAQKALLFGDHETYEKIMSADNPKDYKALGRLVRNFDPETWDENKYPIVLKGNIAKFSQNKAIRDFLIGTGNKILAEASPYDKIWSVRLSMDDPKIQNPNNWRGQTDFRYAPFKRI